MIWCQQTSRDIDGALGFSVLCQTLLRNCVHSQMFILYPNQMPPTSHHFHHYCKLHLELIISSFILLLSAFLDFFFLPVFDKQYGEVKSIWVSKLDTLESESYVTIHSFIYSFTICIVRYTVVHVLTLLDISSGLWGSFITLLRIYFLIHKLGILIIVNIYWVFARCQALYLYYLILYPQQPCKVFTIFTSTL